MTGSSRCFLVMNIFEGILPGFFECGALISTPLNRTGSAIFARFNVTELERVDVGTEECGPSRTTELLENELLEKLTSLAQQIEHTPQPILSFLIAANIILTLCSTIIIIMSIRKKYNEGNRENINRMTLNHRRHRTDQQIFCPDSDWNLSDIMPPPFREAPDGVIVHHARKYPLTTSPCHPRRTGRRALTPGPRQEEAECV